MEYPRWVPTTPRSRLPPADGLPRYVAPLPRWLEDFALRIAPLVVVVNLLGTAFGFWWYRGQFGVEPLLAWPVVPDSPTATLFMAASLGLWYVGRPSEPVNALAFFGCIKLGAWTPYVLLVFASEFTTGPLLYQFMFWSHLAMVAQAFVIHRYADFPVWAVVVAVVWYGLNDVVDYFVPVVGTPHHSALPGQQLAAAGLTHLSPNHELAAAAAVVLTLAATTLALATRVEKLEAGGRVVRGD